MNKSCLVCGVEFYSNHNIKITCSKECSKLRKKAYEANKWQDPAFRVSRQGYMVDYIKRSEVKDKEHAFRKMRNAQPEVKIQKAEYKRNRYHKNINFKLNNILRARLNEAIRNNHKTGSAVSDLGCSIEELKKHLESQFHHNPETGEIMSWENHSRDGWHIDHIRPLASFDLSNADQLKEACRYTNLQPLWCKNNLSKGDIFNE